VVPVAGFGCALGGAPVSAFAVLVVGWAFLSAACGIPVAGALLVEEEEGVAAAAAVGVAVAVVAAPDVCGSAEAVSLFDAPLAAVAPVAAPLTALLFAAAWPAVDLAAAVVESVDEVVVAAGKEDLGALVAEVSGSVFTLVSTCVIDFDWS
jgi:hypothetical protein